MWKYLYMLHVYTYIHKNTLIICLPFHVRISWPRSKVSVGALAALTHIGDRRGVNVNFRPRAVCALGNPNLTPTP